MHLTQWFEYARLELRWAPLDSATGADIYRVDIGREFANTIGYTELIDAFNPKSSGRDRFFPDTGHSLMNGFRSFYERPGIPERVGPPISDEFNIGVTTYQFFQLGAFGYEPSKGVWEVPLGMLDAGLNGRLGPPQPQPPDAYSIDSMDLIALSDMLVGERWIDINLTTFQLTAYVGDFPVLKSVASIGSPYSPTVTGTFSIYLKNEEQDLSGMGWNGSPYYEPSVPWVMYFYEDYAIHGTTWRTYYPTADSQGCVIPPNHVAELLFECAHYGTRVWVHY